MGEDGDGLEVEGRMVGKGLEGGEGMEVIYF
jgi:hypothetical protein